MGEVEDILSKLPEEAVVEEPEEVLVALPQALPRPRTPKGRDIRGRWLSEYDENVALAIVEQVSQGRLLKDACKDAGFPSTAAFQRWCVQHPEVGRAYNAARELSAQAFEEAALEISERLQRMARSKVTTGTQVRAYEAAMAQLRWSAERRDPGKFANRGPVSVQVPIQINTTLDLGASVGAGTAEHPNIYTIEAKVAQPQAATPSPEQEKPLLPRGTRKRIGMFDTLEEQNARNNAVSKGDQGAIPPADEGSGAEGEGEAQVQGEA